MKQIFLVSTFFELVCLAAGIDSGDFDSVAAPALLGTGGVAPDRPTAPPDRERILLISNNAAVLELAPKLLETPGAELLTARFDRVIDLNETLAPAHPSSWKPSNADLPMVEAHLRRVWDLGPGDIELVLESPQVNPAIALGRVFSRATIRVHSDGLMTYGPTRNRIPLTNGQRMSTLHYLPLVDGLAPRLLAEFGIVAKPMSLEAFRSVVAELGAHTGADLVDHLGARGDSDARGPGLDGQPWAFAVGQYLAAIGLLSEDEETGLHLAMLREAARHGLRTVVFKPHPAAPPTQLTPLFAEAESLGIDLRVLESPVLAEVVVERLRPALILGGFSTALATARAVFDVPAIAVGSELLLERITPYQNSNRIPLTIIAELCHGDLPRAHAPVAEVRQSGLPRGHAPSAEVVPAPSVPDTAPSPGDLRELVNAVTYCMSPEFSRDLREGAETFLARVFDADAAGQVPRIAGQKQSDAAASAASATSTASAGDPGSPASAHRFRRYFKRRRLTALGLPGGRSTRIAPRRLVRRGGALAVSAATRQQRRLFQRLRG